MSDYYNVTTNNGDAAIATAIANNTKLNITHIAFGDGNGAVPTPNKARTTLVNEVYRQAIAKYEAHPTIANYLIVEVVIPSDIGGFYIREIGLIADGILISHGSHAPFFKVAEPDGVSEFHLKYTINIQDGGVVDLTLDESLIYATEGWVDENYVPRTEIVDNLITDDAAKPLSAAQGKKLQDEKLAKSSNLSDLENVPTARANLGLGDAATKTVTSSKTDVTIGHLLGVGDFGIGSAISLVSPAVNLNAVVTPGIYGNDTFASATSALNYPFPGQAGSLQVLGSSGSNGYKAQIYTTTSTRRMALRQTSNNGATWSAWREIAFLDSNIDGNAATATKLATTRNIALTGDLTGNANFDGSGNISIAASLGAKLLSATGYKVIGDLVLQWGNTAIPVNSTVVATLPIAVSAILEAVCTYDYPEAGVYPTVAAGNFTTTSLTIGAKASSGSNYNVRWLAICKL